MTRQHALLVLCSAAPVAMAQVPNRSFLDWRDDYDRWWSPVEIATAINDINSEYYLEDFAGIDPGNGGLGDPFSGAGVAFFNDATDFGADFLQVTTVYGLDRTPNESRPSITGLDLSDPVFTFSTVETLIGRSGTTYESGPVMTVRLEDLPLLLPDHDMSWFDGGDPNSHLYVFQTVGPVGEFYVPGPGALSLAAIGGLGAIAGRRRRH
ncbi:MAG: hypothetical protein KDA28_13390 [Phycisphaerales bacterium]|nr:hypothetical protein [Phycisphaerales bacterium]